MAAGKPDAPGWNETLPDWYVKMHGRQPCVNIGTAGHVDHGKTTLIQALTGRWTSVHSQELRRGITIRVGYTDAAFYRCAYGAIASFLKGAGRASAPVIPVSAQSSLNTDALIDSIERTIPTPERDPSEEPVMHVLRSFDVNRPGTEIARIAGGVIGGSLTQGSLKVGDEVEIRPGVLDERRGRHEPLTTEVTSLGTGAGRVEEVRPGGLVAIGTRLDPAMTAGDSLTGSVIGRPGSLPENATSATMDVSLFDSAVGEAGTRIAPVKAGEMLRLSVGTAPALCQAKSAKGGRVTVEFRRSVCLLGGRSVAISRKIADRWRLIGAGRVG